MRLVYCLTVHFGISKNSVVQKFEGQGPQVTPGLLDDLVEISRAGS